MFVKGQLISKYVVVTKSFRLELFYLNGNTDLVKLLSLCRDYHPINVLWLGEEISGIVDWVNAC